MASKSLRLEVLKCFKKLHLARKTVFEEDTYALNLARIKINEEFQKNKSVTDVESIKQLLQLGIEVEKELRTTVVQLKEVEPGKYRMKITDDTVMIKNAECKIDK